MDKQAHGTSPVPQDPDAIVRGIERRQQTLAGTVAELSDRVNPRNVAERTKADLRTRLHEAVYAEDGSLRVERLGAVGAALAALMSLKLVGLVRRRRRRARARAAAHPLAGVHEAVEQSRAERARARRSQRRRARARRLAPVGRD